MRSRARPTPRRKPWTGITAASRSAAPGRPTTSPGWRIGPVGRGCVRSHWAIENSLHWVLDVALRQDQTRIRTGHAPEHLAILQHIALNLLTLDRTETFGIKNKRLAAGWDHDYLLHVIMGAKN